MTSKFVKGGVKVPQLVSKACESCTFKVNCNYVAEFVQNIGSNINFTSSSFFSCFHPNSHCFQLGEVIER